MNIEDFRTFCLSLPGVTEKMPFGRAASEYDRNLLVFSVADKWFCFVNVDAFDFCTLKCPPGEALRLQAACEAVRPAYHMNKQHWISLRLDSGLDDQTIRTFLRSAYDAVIASLPKRTQQALLSR